MVLRHGELIAGLLAGEHVGDGWWDPVAVGVLVEQLESGEGIEQDGYGAQIGGEFVGGVGGGERLAGERCEQIEIGSGGQDAGALEAAGDLADLVDGPWFVGNRPANPIFKRPGGIVMIPA